MIIYKICRKSDGLFSTGGENPKFNDKGKKWNARGHVTSHLSQFKHTFKLYSDCDIIAYEVTEDEQFSMPVSNWKELPETTRSKELQKERSGEKAKESLQEEKRKLEARLKELY